MATVVSRAACEVEKDNMCTVCMDCILEKNQCERPCGHMMCAPCDAAWRSRGKIEEIKMQRKDKKGKEKISIYMTVSNCPSCRRKDSPHDYHSRSKVSLFHEIQMLTRTLHMSGIRVPIAYQASQLTELEEAVTPVPLLRRIIDVFTPYIPPHVPPVPVAPVPAPVPAPIISMSIPPPSQATGICCRRMQQIGECNTTRTKLRCGACQRFLCRSCRGDGCVCQSL
jgi:hypothetical protein